jgi:hypothetical protein
MGEEWLIDEIKMIDEEATRQLERKLATDSRKALTDAEELPYLAVRLQDLIIHDNKKWFFEADIRLDALVIQGRGTKDNIESFYMPQTFRFSRVADGDRLPTGDNGLLIFHGKPLHFLDIFITVSRDRKDTDDLASLLSDQLQSTEITESVGVLLGLAVAAPQVAVVTGALVAAVKLGDFAYQILKKATGSTVGLYRNSYLQYLDNFGIGRHPEKDSRKVKDLSFWYEVISEEVPNH